MGEEYVYPRTCMKPLFLVHLVPSVMSTNADCLETSNAHFVDSLPCLYKN